MVLAQAVKTLERLSDRRLREAQDFVEFLLKKQEEEDIQEGIQYLLDRGESMAFLEEEEEIYSVEDLKERYR